MYINLDPVRDGWGSIKSRTEKIMKHLLWWGKKKTKYYSQPCFEGLVSTVVASRQDLQLQGACACGKSDVQIKKKIKGYNLFYGEKQKKKKKECIMLFWESTYLMPRVGFNLGEFELCIIGIHALDFLPCRST